MQRFGAPFKSEQGEVPPQESELPIMRYIFVKHIRDFPFLDKAREKEFWQDKLQVVRCAIATQGLLLCGPWIKGVFFADIQRAVS